MPDRKSPSSKGTGAPSTPGWVLPVVLASIPVIGTILVAYFNSVAPLKLSLHATQTAEAHVTFTPTPTLSPSPTATEVVITPSLTPTSTPLAPTFTPTAPPIGVKYCVDVAALNVRNGPGTDYDAIGAVYQDDCLYFDGQFLFGDGNYWVRISADQADFSHLAGGWVYGGVLRPQDFIRLPALTPPPPPYHTPTPVF